MCHVLIIEDEAIIAMMIEDALIECGASSVEIVAGEADAVRAAREHRPDFITSDVRLLDGTGPRAVAEIKRICGEVPVLFITGSPDECEGCPPDAIMRKPARAGEIAMRFRALQR